jgi:hypothetical protein
MIGKNDWKKIEATDYFADLVTPDDWETLENFVDWYLTSKMPMVIPWNAEVIRSDDAVAVCIFRKGNYQVELYLEYPKMWIRQHSHPRMEVITMKLGGGKLSPKDSIMDTSKTWGTLSKKLNPGSYHGDNAGGFGYGFVTLAFQRWEDPSEMTSAAIQWKGELQGPVQEDLIRRRKQFAEVRPGYADVTNDTSLTKD